MHINVDERQHEFLLRVVEEYYSNLRAEIYKTDGSTFKDGLKQEEKAVEGLLEQLRAAPRT